MPGPHRTHIPDPPQGRRPRDRDHIRLLEGQRWARCQIVSTLAGPSNSAPIVQLARRTGYQQSERVIVGEVPTRTSSCGGNWLRASIKAVRRT